MQHRLFIGANNTTGVVEKDKIVNEVSKVFDGFTCYPATGYWKGNKEKSLIVEIETGEKKKVQSMILRLKRELRQEAIGYQLLDSIMFV